MMIEREIWGNYPIFRQPHMYYSNYIYVIILYYCPMNAISGCRLSNSPLKKHPISQCRVLRLTHETLQLCLHLLMDGTWNMP